MSSKSKKSTAPVVVEPVESQSVAPAQKKKRKQSEIEPKPSAPVVKPSSSSSKPSSQIKQDAKSSKKEKKGKQEKSKKPAPTDDEDVEVEEEIDEPAEAEEIDFDHKISMHQAELEALKETDPEFYEHLMKEDQGLLNFGADDDELEADDQADDDETAAALDGAEEDEETPKQQKTKKKSELEELTTEALKKLETQCLEQHSLSALKKLLKIFHSACHSLREHRVMESETGTGKGAKGDVRKLKKKVSDGGSKADVDENMKGTHARLHDHVVSFCLKHMDAVFEHHVPTEKKDGVLVVNTSSSAWRKIGPYVKSYVSNLLHLGPMLVDERLTRLAIAHFGRVHHLLVPFSRLPNKLAKMLLEFFSSGEEMVRIDAFLLLRHMALHGMQTMVDFLLKHTYLTFVRNAKFYNKNSAPTIHLMANCVVELFSLFPRSAYQFCFVYLRQLAIHLRTAILNKSKQSWESVYNWQFVNCLRVFAMLLTNMCQGDPAALAAAANSAKGRDAAATAAAASSASAGAESELYPLVYPFVQICLSVMELMPNVRFYPLRFLCARLLNSVCRATGVYVPLAPHLLPVLQMAQFEKKTRNLIKGKISSFDFSLHVSKNVVVSKHYQDYAFTEALRLLLQHFAIYSYSIAFPELVVPALLQLKKFAKSTKVLRFAKQVQSLIRQLEQQSDWVLQRRNTVEVSPSSIITVHYFRAKSVAGHAKGGSSSGSDVAPLEQYAKQLAGGTDSTKLDVKNVKSKKQLEDDGDYSDEDEWEVPAKKPKTREQSKKQKTAKASKSSDAPSELPEDEDDVRDFQDFSDEDNVDEVDDDEDEDDEDDVDMDDEDDE